MIARNHLKQGQPSSFFISKARGFTLIELVMVIVVLGILSVVVMPKMFNRTDFEKRGYGDELMQATRYAQKLAIASGCEVRITINASNFTLAQPANAAQCGSGAINWSTPVSLPGKASPYNAPSGVTVTSGTGSIVFSPAGLASAAASIKINGTNTLQIHAATGYVERL